MRQHRLLIAAERGSVLVSTVGAIVLLLAMVLGTIQIAWALYARNVTMASAHEAARAAVELGADDRATRDVAEQVIRRAAGGLIEELSLATQVSDSGTIRHVRVTLGARLRNLGPIPFPMNVVTSAAASAVDEVP